MPVTTRYTGRTAGKSRGARTSGSASAQPGRYRDAKRITREENRIARENRRAEQEAERLRKTAKRTERAQMNRRSTAGVNTRASVPAASAPVARGYNSSGHTVESTSRAARSHTAKRAPKVHALDVNMLLVILLLQTVGLIALFSASYSNGLYYHDSPVYFIRLQGIYAACGILAMIFISKLKYTLYQSFYQIIMAVSVVLLVLVAIPGVGTKLNGARRWLFGFQPSELAKLAVIVCFAHWISRDTGSLKTFKGLVKPYGLLLLVYIGLLFLEPHTSAMLIICGIGVAMLVAGGMRLWYFAPILCAGAGIVFIFYTKYDHVQQRFKVWLNPFIDMLGDGFQGSMSQIAIGSGGLLGRGLGQGYQKHLYLPEPQNDFIFASWCEEMGLVGAVIVILLFGYLIYRGFVVARAAPDKFSCMVATGITVKLAIQTLMNLFVVTGIIPVTGAALPFFSYGGTALMMQLGEMGILLNISRYMRIDAKADAE